MKEIIVKITFDETKNLIDCDWIRGCMDDCCVNYESVEEFGIEDFRTFYPNMIASQLSSIQPMPNDMKILMPDLLKDMRNDV